MAGRTRRNATERDAARTKPRKKGGADARAEAVRLLSEGLSVTEVARQVGVSRQTVSGWKNHTAAPALDAAREVQAKAFEDAVASARAKIRDGTLRAAEVLVEQLTHTDPSVRASAARTILDRGGLPRVEVVESSAAPLDLSGLTDEELTVFEALLTKVKGSR